MVGQEQSLMSIVGKKKRHQRGNQISKKVTMIIATLQLAIISLSEMSMLDMVQ